MKTRWSIAGLALATVLAVGATAAWADDANAPQKVTLSIPNTQ